jgi:hypothetical protein
MRTVELGATPQIKEPTSKRNKAARNTNLTLKMV